MVGGWWMGGALPVITSIIGSRKPTTTMNSTSECGFIRIPKTLVHIAKLVQLSMVLVVFTLAKSMRLITRMRHPILILILCSVHGGQAHPQTADETIRTFETLCLFSTSSGIFELTLPSHACVYQYVVELYSYLHCYYYCRGVLGIGYLQA